MDIGEREAIEEGRKAEVLIEKGKSSQDSLCAF